MFLFFFDLVVRRINRKYMHILAFAGAFASFAFGAYVSPYLEKGIAGLLKEGISGLVSPSLVLDQKAISTGLLFVLLYAVTVMVFTGRRNNYRYLEEHGSARWGDIKAINRKYSDRDELSNKILTEGVSMSIDAMHHRRNLNTIVCGGSGAGKTRYYGIPNLLQANTSFVVLDPKGELLKATGKVLEDNGYDIKVLDLINMEKSHCYNPFCYLRNDNDIQKLVTNIFKSSNPKDKGNNDPFWDTAASMLLLSLIFYLHYEAPEEEQNFAMVMDLLRAGNIEGDDDRNEMSILDRLFAELYDEDPGHIALKYYRNYRSAGTRTLKSIQITLASKLEKFNLESVSKLTSTDELGLEELGERKKAVFALISDTDPSFNFLVSILYTQMFQSLFYMADYRYGGSLKVPVHFLMDEFANISIPNEFESILSVMRSRGIFVSIIIQNISQLKARFEKEWESITGNCDSFLYLGGNEEASHKYVSQLLGRETIDVRTYTRNMGRNGSYTQNNAVTGRDLMFSSEVRELNEDECILFIRGEEPVKDRKYDLSKHRNYHYLEDRKDQYDHGGKAGSEGSIEVLGQRYVEEKDEDYESRYMIIEDMDDVFNDEDFSEILL